MSDASAPATVGPLAPLTTLRLGGPPRRMVTAVTAEQIVASVRDCARDEEPTLLVAGGSNMVISDQGFPGTAILLRSTGLSVTASGSTVDVTVEAGTPWDDVVATAVDEGWAGIECLSGIPGSAGATPIQNVGAYGQSVAETITVVEAYDRVTDEFVALTPDECDFGYRNSRFKYSSRFVVLSVSFRLSQSTDSTPIRYAELARILEVPLGARVPLADARKAVLVLRAGKGMVLDPADPDACSVGSFFTNPVLDAAAYGRLLERAGGEPPSWPGPDGTVKISAAWLIEKAGYRKGYGHGGVAISGKHTLALTNRGSGTTDELLALAREIRSGVHGQFGVTLLPEPTLVNCSLQIPSSI